MLHVWLPAQHTQLLVWQDKPQQWQAYQNWQKISDEYGKQSVCLYFPSRHVLQVTSELSVAQMRQLGDAGRQYLFEDIALSAVEQLQVRQLDVANQHYLYALASTEIKQWQDSAALAGMTMAMLLPDFVLLPTPETGTGEITLYQDDDTSLVRLSQANGMAVSYLPLLIESLLVGSPAINESTNDSTQPDKPNKINKSQAISEQQSLSDIVLLKSINDALDNHERADKVITQINDVANDEDFRQLLMEKNIHLAISSDYPMPIESNRHPLNFVMRNKQQKLSPYLTTTILVAIMALLVQLVADAVGDYRYKKAVDATNVAINAQYQAWFPNERLNSRTKLQAQLQPKLANANGTEDVGMTLLSRLMPMIKQANLAAQSLNLDDGNVRLKLIADNRNHLDGFVQELNQQGISATLGSISKDGLPASSEQSGDNKVIGEVSITQPVL